MILSLNCPKCGRLLELPMADASEADAQAIARLVLCEPCHPPVHEMTGRACDPAKSIADVRAGHGGTGKGLGGEYAPHLKASTNLLRAASDQTPFPPHE